MPQFFFYQVLLQLDPFLNELTSMFEHSTEKGSVWVTLKRCMYYLHPIVFLFVSFFFFFFFFDKYSLFLFQIGLMDFVVLCLVF